jgi:hypothetical protein
VTDPRIAALWVDVLGKLSAPAAHAVNNALNNVAINLAVLQSRPDAKAYAEKADGYLTEASRLAKAVLALARPVSTPVEPASLVHQLVGVIEGAGRQIEVVDEPGTVITTSIDGAAVRLALAAALADGGVGRVHIVRGGELIRIEGAALPADVADAIRRAGVGLRVGSGEVTFTFSGAAIPA